MNDAVDGRCGSQRVLDDLVPLAEDDTGFTVTPAPQTATPMVQPY